MAADLFLEWYEYNKNTRTFDFGKFANEGLVNFSPDRKSLDFGSTNKNFILRARDVVVFNLSQNEYFKKKVYHYQILDQFKNLLDVSKHSFDDDILIRLSFMVHLSKANLKQDYFEVLFQIIDSLKVVECKNFPEIDQLFTDLIENQIVQSVLEDTFNDLMDTNIKTCELDIKSIQIKYFTCSLIDLNGLSGKNIIYVNHYTMTELMNNLSQMHTNEQCMDVLKLFCVRVFVHENIHVLLRRNLNDFNFSTPTLFSDSKRLNETYSIQEAGHIADRKIFNENIDWMKTCSEPKFDVMHCQNFLRLFLLNDKKAVFNPKVANVVPMDMEEYGTGMDLIMRQRKSLGFLF